MGGFQPPKEKGRRHRSSRDDHHTRRRGTHAGKTDSYVAFPSQTLLSAHHVYNYLHYIETQEESRDVESEEDEDIPRTTGPIPEPSTTILGQDAFQATSQSYAYGGELNQEPGILADGIAGMQMSTQESYEENAVEDYEEEAPEYEFIVDENQAYFQRKDGEESSRYPRRKRATEART
jgi:hypothetical protein